MSLSNYSSRVNFLAMADKASAYCDSLVVELSVFVPATVTLRPKVDPVQWSQYDRTI